MVLIHMSGCLVHIHSGTRPWSIVTPDFIRAVDELPVCCFGYPHVAADIDFSPADPHGVFLGIPIKDITAKKGTSWHKDKNQNKTKTPSVASSSSSLASQAGNKGQQAVDTGSLGIDNDGSGDSSIDTTGTYTCGARVIGGDGPHGSSVSSGGGSSGSGGSGSGEEDRGTVKPGLFVRPCNYRDLPYVLFATV